MSFVAQYNFNTLPSTSLTIKTDSEEGEAEGVAEEQKSNTDENSDSYEEGERSRKKKRMRLSIPGERKSARSKTGGTSDLVSHVMHCRKS